MDEALSPPQIPAPRHVVRDVALLVGAAVVILALSGLLLARALGPIFPGTPAAVPVSPEIEARWGVRVTQVAPTADGGLVDVRFTVLDPDKALDLMSDVNNLPVLHVDGSDVVVRSAAAMAPGHNVLAGRTYFILYRNAEGSVRPGTSVSILFGDLSLDHVVAR